MIALEHRSGRDDRTGALALIASKPFGQVLLWFLVAGFAGMALWRAVVAAHPDSPRRAKAMTRLSFATGAVANAAAAYTTARFAADGQSSDASETAPGDFTAAAFRHTGGRVLVGLVGVAVVIGAFVMIRNGVLRRFTQDLAADEIAPAARPWVLRLGTAGYAARGIVVGILGGFLVYAAATIDAAAAKGLDASLRSVAEAPFGTLLLVLMALGLAAYGAFEFCLARWLRA